MEWVILLQRTSYRPAGLHCVVVKNYCNRSRTIRSRSRSLRTRKTSHVCFKKGVTLKSTLGYTYVIHAYHGYRIEPKKRQIKIQWKMLYLRFTSVEICEPRDWTVVATIPPTSDRIGVLLLQHCSTVWNSPTQL